MNTNLSKSLIIILILFAISCTQNDDDNVNFFSFRINVKDNIGNPIEGYKVYVRNQLSYYYREETRTSAIIVFALRQDCNLKLEIYDLNNTLVNSLINAEKSAGWYSFNYCSNYYDSGEPIMGDCNILKCNIVATHLETAEVLYDNTIFMCRYTFCNDIGLTNSDGVFQTTNKLYFPHLYEIPEMRYISEQGDIICPFTLEDTVDITIYDPVTETSKTFDRVVKEGENNFNLVWDSDRNKSNIINDSNSIPNNGSRSVEISSYTVSYIDEVVIIEWTTQSETDNYGWNVYRGENDIIEYAIPVNNSMIPGMGTSYEPVNYSFTDEYIEEETTYWYWLESITYDGVTQIFGPVSITIPEIEPDPPMEWYIQHYPNPFN